VKPYGVDYDAWHLLKKRRGKVVPKDAKIAPEAVPQSTDRRALIDLISDLKPISDNRLNMVRFGPNGDGGYLLPDDIEGITACYSPGVSYKSGFEAECANRGMQVFMADKSVDHPGEQHDSFHFKHRFLGSFTNEDFMTLDDWVSESDSSNSQDSDLLFQMDIEGAEYEVLHQTPEKLLERFRIIVIEFHHLDSLWSPPFFSFASQAFRKILKTHVCVHIHPNNACDIVERDGISIPPVMEFSFLRKDRLSETTPADQFPHPLDFDNTTRPSISLPTHWYS
jgi:hypothetical protein